MKFNGSKAKLQTADFRGHFSWNCTTGKYFKRATTEKNRTKERNYQAHELETILQLRDASSLFEGAKPPYHHHHHHIPVAYRYLLLHFMIPTYTDSSYYNLYFRLNRILATTFYIFDAYRYFYHILYFRRIPIIPTIFFQYFYHILYFRHILILPIKFFISDAYRYFLPHFTFWFILIQ